MKSILLDGIEPITGKIYVMINKITHFYSFNGKTIVYFDSMDNYIAVKQSPEEIYTEIHGQV